ncbi:GAF domain-containing protein [Cupriavidus basilensis]
MDDATLLPSLFAPQELRWSKARERFFCDFQRPTGLVRDAVIQSWERCLLGGRKTEEAIVLRTISHSALKSVIRRSQRLIDAASPVLAHLEIALEGAGCCISLVNADGLIVRSSPARRLTGEILRRLSRPGVDISENAIGTSAPGIALKTGQLARVEGGEHFFEGQAMIRCVAVPIRYARGMLAGALNVATEARSFGFDPGPILATYASIIENRILRAQPSRPLSIEVSVRFKLARHSARGIGRGPTRWHSGVAQLSW